MLAPDAPPARRYFALVQASGGYPPPGVLEPIEDAPDPALMLVECVRAEDYDAAIARAQHAEIELKRVEQTVNLVAELESAIERLAGTLER